MTSILPEPNLTNDGIAFTVRVESINRACIISHAALDKLSLLKNIESDPMSTYRAFEATINGVARRMVAANVPGTPLMLGPQTFR